MTKDFDAYHKWLGIPPKDQPPNHYRLLALDLYESDPEVIDTAANRQMSYLQQRAAGQHAALSQKLLNEIAAARLCLLDPKQKAAYDADLKTKLESLPEATEPNRSDYLEPDPFAFLQSGKPSAQPTVQTQQDADHQRQPSRTKPRSKAPDGITMRRVAGSLLAGAVGILVAVVVFARGCEKNATDRSKHTELAATQSKKKPSESPPLKDTQKPVATQDSSSPLPEPKLAGADKTMESGQEPQEARVRTSPVASSERPQDDLRQKPFSPESSVGPVTTSEPKKLIPGRGWRRLTETKVFRVEKGGGVQNPSDLPQDIHGKFHSELRNWPQFSVTSLGESWLEFLVEGQSKPGGTIVCYVDGTTVGTFDFPGTGQVLQLSKECRVRIPPGKHLVQMRNEGKGSIRIGWYRFRGQFADPE